MNFDAMEKRSADNYDTLRWADKDLPHYFSETSLINDLKNAVSHLSIYRPRAAPLGPWKPLPLPYQKGIVGRGLRPETIDYASMGMSSLDVKYDYNAFLEKDQADLEHFNAVHLDYSAIEDLLCIDLYSVDEEGIRRELDYLKAIPFVSNGVETQTVHKFSSRIAFKAYPPAIAVWAFNRLENPVPVEVLRYVLGAVHYFEEGEWRISSVLSAIAVESILAEMFEELIHRQAPPDTLGELLKQVVGSTQLPKAIKEDAELVNTNRIMSVHRSTSEAGETEALSSLVGCTRFTHWAYTSGVLARPTM